MNLKERKPSQNHRKYSACGVNYVNNIDSSLKMLSRGKSSSLFGLFVGDEENKFFGLNCRVQIPPTRNRPKSGPGAKNNRTVAGTHQRVRCVARSDARRVQTTTPATPVAGNFSSSSAVQPSDFKANAGRRSLQSRGRNRTATVGKKRKAGRGSLVRAATTSTGKRKRR